MGKIIELKDVKKTYVIGEQQFNALDGVDLEIDQGEFVVILGPSGALITILLTNLVVPVLPYLLSFAAGAMVYVVVEELIPEAQDGEHSNLATIGVAIGFVIMMILDVALG